MNVDKLSILMFLALPFAASLIPQSARPGNVFSKGAAATVLRILILVGLGRAVIMLGSVLQVNWVLVEGYPLDVLLSLDSYRYGFLLTAEFCFLLAHWMCPAAGANSGMIRVLVCFAQGISSFLVLSDNSASTGAFLLLAGTVFFYLVRFSIPAQGEADRENIGASISTRMHVLFYLLGLMTIAWGIAEFSERGLVFGRGAGSVLGLPLWLALVILSVPLPPWSRWFGRAVEFLPEGVTLTIVIFLSALTLKLASLFSVAYPDLGWKQKLLLYVLGIVGCIFSVGGLFASPSRHRMLGCLPSFFFSIILVSLGVSRNNLVLSAYFTCLFVPVFTGLLLSASAMTTKNSLQKFFVGFLFTLILGVPGTPVYQIFSRIGARSLDLGIGYTIVFGLLWFFYFNANVHIYRRIFMDQDFPETSEVVRLDLAPGFFAGYGVFLMFLVIVIAQIAGRIL